MAEKLIKMRNLAQVGVVKDQPAISLPPQTWSDVRNVRFENNRVEKMKGHIQILKDLEDTDGSVIKPTIMTYWRTPEEKYYVYGTQTELFLMDKDTDISYLNPSGTTFNDDGVWQISFFTGGYVLLVNNGEDVPHYANGYDTTIRLAPIENWNYTSGIDITAGLVVGYKNVIVAGDITSENTTSGELDGIAANSTRYQPGTIRVSTQAPAGGIPETFQPGSTSDTADEFEISSTAPMRAMVPLQGQLILYTSDSIHALTIGQSSTIVTDVADGYGALGRNTVCEYDGRHFVVDASDIYIFSGSPNSIQSVVDDRIKDYFYSNLHPDYVDNIIVRRYKSQGEIWVAYPTLNTENGYADEALIWNYHRNTWTIRDLQSASGMVEGGVNGGGVLTQRITVTGTAGTGAQYVFTRNRSNGSSESSTVDIASNTAAQTATDIKNTIDAFPEFTAVVESSTQVLITSRQYSSNGTTFTSVLTDTNGSQAITTDTETTLDTERPWPADFINDDDKHIVFCDYDEGKLHAVDYGYQFDDTDYVSYAEKMFTDYDEITDSSFIKHAMNLYPISETGKLKVTVAISNVPGEKVTISSDSSAKDFIFDPTDSYDISVDISGRYHHFRFEDDPASSNGPWTLSGYDVGIMTDGMET